MQSVIDAVFRKDDNILLVKHVKNKGRWIFPAGKVESGETNLEALKREMMEELGICISDQVIVEEYSEHITCDRIDGIKKYLIEHFSIRGHIHKITNMEPEKHTEIKWFTLHEIFDMWKKGETYDYVVNLLSSIMKKKSRNKDYIKQWLLQNTTNELGQVDLSGIDFGDITIQLSRIKTNRSIFNWGQEAEFISNSEQKANNIENDDQESEKIDNMGQTAKIEISNRYQICDNIRNQDQRAKKIFN